MNENTSSSQDNNSIERPASVDIDLNMEFCPEGWDAKVESYYRLSMVYKEEEDLLLDHIFACAHCRDHLHFLDAIQTSLQRLDHSDTETEAYD